MYDLPDTSSRLPLRPFLAFGLCGAIECPMSCFVAYEAQVVLHVPRMLFFGELVDICCVLVIVFSLAACSQLVSMEFAGLGSRVAGRNVRIPARSRLPSIAMYISVAR